MGPDQCELLSRADRVSAHAGSEAAAAACAGAGQCGKDHDGPGHRHHRLRREIGPVNFPVMKY